MKNLNSFFKRSFFLLLTLASISIINSCEQKQESDAPSEVTLQKELDDVTEIIKSQNARFVKFYLEGNADSLANIFAENVRQYLSHQPPTKGITSLIETNRQLMTWGTWDFEITTDEIKKSGSLVVERGRYSLKFSANDSSPIPSSEDTGNYIVLWEQKDGEWKIVWDAPVTEVPLPLPE